MRMPNKERIRLFWQEILFSMGKFTVGGCFACGRIADLERAHILSRNQGGNNSIVNIHLLCRNCHKESEFLEQKEYWIFLVKKTGIEASSPSRSIGEITSIALRNKIKKMERIGSIPYGLSLSDDGIHLIPNHQELKLIESARKLKGEGLSLRRIGERLIELGFVPRSKKKFHPVTLQNIIKLKLYEMNERKDEKD